MNRKKVNQRTTSAIWICSEQTDHRLHLVYIPGLNLQFSRLHSRPSSRSVYSSYRGLLSVSQTLHQAAQVLAQSTTSSILPPLCLSKATFTASTLSARFVTDITTSEGETSVKSFVFDSRRYSLRLASGGLKASRLKVDKLTRRHLKH